MLAESETTPANAAAAPPCLKRTSLNGCWILDKTRGTPSMRGYLETMGVTEMAIEAHEKGESERNTYHTIELDDKKLKITKQSRVNNNLIVELELGKENVEHLPPPGDRVKRSLAISNDTSHLEIRSSLSTMNGMARVLDVKTLVEEEDKTVMVQELTVTNEQMGTTHTTTRYFNPSRGLDQDMTAPDAEMAEATI